MQTKPRDDNEEAIAGTTTTASLLSPPYNSTASMNHNQISAGMKCYFYCKQNCFLDYFDDPILDVAVIYMSDISFQYSERGCKYTKFIGTPKSTIFVANKRDHEFLLCKRSNTSNMSCNPNNFGQLSITKICSDLTKIAPANTGGTSHHTDHAQKRYADVKYLGRVKMVLSSHVGGITFADLANIRKSYKELMTEVRSEAIHISNKYEIQVNPIQFEWTGSFPHYKKDFQHILNEMFSHYSQQQLTNSNETRSTPNENREQYHGGIGNRTNTLSPLTRHPYIVDRFQHMSHSTPETTNTYSGNDHFTNCTYQGTQNSKQTYYTAPFSSSNIPCEQQGINERGSNNWLYSTSAHEYYNDVFHDSKITPSN